MRALLTLVILMAVSTSNGQPLLKLPFGRQWGEEPSGLLQWAGKVKLDVFVELPADAPALQVFRFQEKGGGIPSLEANSVEARFHKDRLYELTINYEFPGKTPDEVRERFHKMKRALEKGRGEFRKNGRAQNVDDNFLTREESFHYETAPGVFLLMAYSSVEDLLRKEGEARFSVIYHNGTVGPAAGKGVAPPAQSATGESVAAPVQKAKK